MIGSRVLLALCLAGASAAPVFASHQRGIDVSVSIDASGGIVLSWTGGQPGFTISRSSSPRLVQEPGSEIGTTDLGSWTDFPPPGNLFFYDITGTCTPEVCDGVDNDCDGVVDGPGSEASCNLPNASAACVDGACAIAGCASGFGDCNGSPADGCETDTHVAQSTSPASLWSGDPSPDQDLMPGYQRVTAIADCGACGTLDPAASCDDGIACTTDLCVPVNGMGVCRHYDRSQCSEARCGSAVLPPGTPAPRDAACAGMDADGDGLPAAWESPQPDPYGGSAQPMVGVDLNCNGVIAGGDGDLIWHEPPAGDAIKDVYLTYDYMAPASNEPSGHAPPAGSIAEVVSAFARQGIVMHVDPNASEIPHADVVYLPVTGNDACASPTTTSLQDLKAAHFDARRRVGYHYAVFGHESCYVGTSPDQQASGLSEIRGNDFVVSLAGFTYASGVLEEPKHVREFAGTLMHEIGHNLGLCHDGPADPNGADPCAAADSERKPNHISSMNQIYQLTGILRAVQPGSITPLDPNLPRRVDFSFLPVDPLDEGSLDEAAGANVTPPPFDRDVLRHICPGSGIPALGPASGPVDWDCDGQIDSAPVAVDVNDDGALQILDGAADWPGLRFDFQCQPAFADGPLPAPLAARSELTPSEAEARHLRADATALCDPGFDDCDGLASNGCETPIFDDPANCGGCGLSCAPAGDSCQAGICGCGAGPSCDTLFCTQGAQCAEGICSGGTPRDCGGGAAGACTIASCDETADLCLVSCTSQPCWEAAVGDGTAAAPVSDAPFSAAGATRQFVSKGTALYAIRNVDEAEGPAGSVAWQWNAPSTLSNFPAPVPFDPSSGTGIESLYVGAGDGRVYKLRGGEGMVLASADVRRPICAADAVMATPAVQLYRYSNAAFRAEVDSHAGRSGDDVVFVITRDGCGTRSANRILALWGSDLSTKWIFNQDATSLVDAGTEGCSIDYDTNTLYCGTDRAAGFHQNSLWAIGTVDGTRRWSHNGGAVLNRPILHNGTYGPRLYVANGAGSLQAYDPAGDGAGGARALWVQPVILPGPVLRNVWPEFRPGGFGNRMFLVDQTGMLTAVDDEGQRGVAVWSVGPGRGVQFVTAPVASSSGRVFVGRSDGYVQQINAATGALEGLLAAGSAPGSALFDPAIDPAAGTVLQRLTLASGPGTSGGLVQQFCVPGTDAAAGSCHGDADCGAWDAPCAVGRCDTGSGVCFSEPAPDNAPCEDGLSCTTSSTCVQGACVAADYGGCACSAAGDVACPTGLTCCGSAAGCVDVNTHPGHCGGCGAACGAGQICVMGHCERDLNACPAGVTLASRLAAAGSALVGADAVDYEKTSSGQCSAYVSTYATSVAGSVKRIDPGGLVTSVPISTPTTGPLNGVDVPAAGDLFFAGMVNTSTGSTPGMATGTMSSGTGSRVINANPTSGTVPFSDARFDTGPVGPALDRARYDTNPLTPEVYFGNWLANGDLYRISRSCASCSWFATSVGWVHPSGERVTALAFAQRPVTPGGVYHRYLVIGHGTGVTLIDLDSGQQKDTDLSMRQPPVAAILGLSTDPVYGDIYMLAEDPAPGTATRILVVRPYEDSVHDLRDVHADLKIAPQLPPWFTVEGRISADSGVVLEMMVPVIGAAPSSWLDIQLIP